MAAPTHSRSDVQPSLAQGRRRGSVFQLITTSYFVTFLGLVTGPIVARTLGPTGRGEYAAVMIYGSTAGTVLALGLGSSVKHAVLTLHQDTRVVYGLSIRFCILLVPLSLAAGIGAAVLLPGLSEVARIGVFVTVGVAPLGVLQMAQMSLLNAEGALGPLAWIRVTPIALSALGVVVLAALGRLGLAEYIALAIITDVLAVVQSVWAVRLRPARGGRLGPFFSFGLKAYPSSLASIANNQLDQLLIAPVLTTRDLGLYAIAVTVASLPLGVANALSFKSLRDAARVDGGLDPERCAKNLRQAVLLVLVVSLGLMALAPVLVPLLYGRSFGDAILPCLVLLPGTLALTVSSITGQSLVIAGRPGAASTSQLYSLVVTVVGLAVTVPTLGVLGAALTSTAAYWVRSILQVRSLRREGVTDLGLRRSDVVELSSSILSRLRSLGHLGRKAPAGT